MNVVINNIKGGGEQPEVKYGLKLHTENNGEALVGFYDWDCIVPDGVRTISSNAFYECGILRSLTLPESVDIIGDGAFYKCTHLGSVKLPDSMTTISSRAFAFSHINDLVLPRGVTYVGSESFRACSELSRIVVPDDFPCLPEALFGTTSTDFTKLAVVTIPQGWKPTAGDLGWNIMLGFRGMTVESTAECANNLAEWTDTENQCVVYLNMSIQASLLDVQQTLMAKGYSVQWR